jgi:hypothetical protein
MSLKSGKCGGPPRHHYKAAKALVSHLQIGCALCRARPLPSSRASSHTSLSPASPPRPSHDSSSNPNLQNPSPPRPPSTKSRAPSPPRTPTAKTPSRRAAPSSPSRSRTPRAKPTPGTLISRRRVPLARASRPKARKLL